MRLKTNWCKVFFMNLKVNSFSKKGIESTMKGIKTT